MNYTIVFIIAYLCGAVPWGYLIGKMKGIDIRRHGSGNIGATNVTRTLGGGYGKLCFALDALKGFLPAYICNILITKGVFTANPDTAMIIAAFGAVVGHMWPVYLKFKGGKGISTSGGALLAIAPGAFICSALLWIIIFKSSRYVSLASILAAASLPLNAWWLNLVNWSKTSAITIAFLAILGILAVVRHHSNIKRLLNGTENRFAPKAK